MKFIFKISLFLFVLLIGLSVLAIYWTFYKPLPSYNVTLRMDGLQQPVDVHWDPYRIPHIYARNEDDLYFTIGYIHAQERLWQMTLSQIAAEGRFAEFLGEDLVPFDIYQRTLNIWHTAGKIESESDPHLIHILQKYADGINHYVNKHQNYLPIEFSLLGIKPIEWTPRHSIAVARLMAWDQNMHWWSELTYAYLAEKLEPLQFQQLIPVYSDEFPTTITNAGTNRAAESALAFLETEISMRSKLSKNGFPFGSNAWAVNGSKTESGLPMLAGDPHMGLSIPGYWYEVYYHTPDHQLAGTTIPGAPFIVLGQNKQLAWSMTNIMADDTDFFIEAVDPSNPQLYVADSLGTSAVHQHFRERREIIQVNGGNDKVHVVRSTRNGPVISDIHPSAGLLEDKVVTLRWMGHEISHELWAMYQMNRAENMQQFRNAVEMFHSPGMNFIYADADDNIAIFTGASLPVRDFNPLTFRKGWDPLYQWNGTIPFDELPHLVNPESGYVAHANNKMHTDNYPHYISTFWEPPSRIIRIEQLLESSDNLTVEYMQAMQYDVFSEHSRDITELILPILRGDPNPDRFRIALSYLENWDHHYYPTSTAASIFDLFFMKFAEIVLKDDLGEEAYNTLVRLEHLAVMILTRMLEQDSSFFNIVTTPELETRSHIVRESMAMALEELTDRFGSEPSEWRWENLHSLTLKPPLLGEASEAPDAPVIFRIIVNNLFSKGPFSARGHGMTINKGQYSWHRPFEMDLGASIRRIIDFSSPERTLSVLPTGQSGNPFSANYGDQTNLWLEGRYRFIYQDSTFFQQTSYETMTLLPAE
ncbi:MAG: penicillin acylase family protein [Balneolaceae bacterium]|nr:MAG: penicillin acylase family protein [Balneolaceae bacterium]